MRLRWLGTVGTNGLILAAGLATGILTARLLGPEDRGLLASLVFWPALLAGIGFFSLEESIVYHLGKHRPNERRLPPTVLALAILMSLPVIALGALLLPVLLGPERAASVELSRLYLLLFVPLNFIGVGLLALDHGSQRFRSYNILRTLPPLTYLAGLAALLLLDEVRVESVLWATCLGTGLVAAACLWRWRRRFFVAPDLLAAKRLVRHGLAFHGAMLLTLLSSQIDRVVALTLFTDSEIGHYVVAVTLASAGLGVVSSAVHTILFPQLSSEPDRDEAIRQLGEGLRRSLQVTLAGSCLLLCALPFAVPMLLGEAYGEAVPLAALLVLAFIPLALRQIAVRSLRAFGDGKTGMIAEAVALAGFALSVLPLVRAHSLIGLPAALIAGNLIALGVLAWLLARTYGLRPGRWLLPWRRAGNPMQAPQPGET